MLSIMRNGVRRFLTSFNLKVSAILFILAVIAGPFGVHDLGTIAQQATFWLSVVVISSLLGHICTTTAESFWGEERAVLVDLTLTGLMTMLFTPVLFYLINTLIVDPARPGVLYLEAAGYVFAITAAISLFRRIMPGVTTHTYFKREPLAEEPRLTRRLPDDFVDPIIRLTVRDHYVDVITAEATHTLRMRFADAVEEMEPVSGFYTHRSHWVCRAAVAGSEKDGGRLFLRLINGDLVPVSRTYRSDLEDAGLIEDLGALA